MQYLWENCLVMASIQTDNTYKYRWSELISKNQIGTYFLYMWLKNQSFLPSKSAYFYNWISSRKMWFKNKLDFVEEEKWLFTLPKNWLGNWIWEGSAAMPALVVSEKKSYIWCIFVINQPINGKSSFEHYKHFRIWWNRQSL